MENEHPDATPVYNIWSTAYDIMWETYFIVTEQFYAVGKYWKWTYYCSRVKHIVFPATLKLTNEHCGNNELCTNLESNLLWVVVIKASQNILSNWIIFEHSFIW
jgi:hypothetical protein